MLGAWWAYHVLGWGGYWGWDPVENSAIMPWLIGTAFIHSFMIQERRGMLKVWNMVLVMVTFYLAIFGTFVVRSGVINSVHSFALSALGPVLPDVPGAGRRRLARPAVLAAAAAALRQPPRLAAVARGELPAQQPALSGHRLRDLLGHDLPAGLRGASATKISVGPPYFKQVAGPLLGAMLLLMGIGPLMPWRRASPEQLEHSFMIPVGASLGGLLILLIAGVRDPFALLGFGLCLFVVGTIFQEFMRGALARHSATGQNYVLAIGSLIRRNNRRYGGYLVHLAIVLIGAGALGSQIYQQQTQVRLAPGQSVSLAGYTLVANGIQTTQQPGVKVIDGRLTVNGTDEIRPERQYFDNFPQQPSTKVGIRSTPFEDLYVVLGDWTGDGSAAQVESRDLRQPASELDLGGGVLLLLGTTVTMWPAPAPSRRRAVAPARGAIGVEA